MSAAQRTLAALALAPLSACTSILDFEKSSEEVPAGPTASYAMTFSEECSTDTLDPLRFTTHWITDASPHRVLAHTYEHMLDEAVSVSDGLCRITAQPATVGDRPFTSGVLTTATSFVQRYGHFETRFRAPDGKGLWATFWVRHQTKWPPALQAIVFGHQPDEVRFAVEWWDAEVPTDEKVTFSGPSFTDDFHILGIEWSPDEFVFYVDGIERHRTRNGTGTFTEPMELALALLVGHRDSSYPPYPDATTPWPARLEVDWIRVFRAKDD
jgi:beta-glucanase (GH16 family)